jgi:DNA-binding NtrC family response regulator
VNPSGREFSDPRELLIEESAAMTSIRVLIADHEELLSENYAAFYREISWESAVATTGLQCVKQLRTFRPDVLILEPELPWGGGAGVLAEMHGVSEVPLARVMILTAGRDKDELMISKSSRSTLTHWHEESAGC